MDSTKSLKCACCGSRASASSRRPLINKGLRLFVGARIYPEILPETGYICGKCRTLHNRWKMLAEVHVIMYGYDDEVATSRAGPVVDNYDFDEHSSEIEAMEDDFILRRQIDELKNDVRLNDEENYVSHRESVKQSRSDANTHAFSICRKQ